ncbi:hypothetical protein BC826DRAFT_182253 [Russula brevipes]|nr:hypothetical protein BC826DRAFT_182253 [Russula brevipes]
MLNAPQIGRLFQMTDARELAITKKSIAQVVSEGLRTSERTTMGLGGRGQWHAEIASDETRHIRERGTYFLYQSTRPVLLVLPELGF